MPQPLIAISNACVRGPAGVAALYFIDGDSVRDLTFNLLDRITAISLVAGTSLLKCEFEIGSASFNQTLSRSKGWPRVTQKVSFEHDGLPNQVLRALKRLGEHCNVHTIVETNAGQFFYMGISYYADRAYLWDSGNCTVTSGSARVDKEGGQARTVTTLQAITRQFAPEVEADVSLLPIEEPPPPDPEVDNADPVAILFVPADDAVGVSINTPIEIYFNEEVKAGTGFLNVRRYSDDVLVFQANIADPLQVQFDAVAWKLSILSPPTLAYSTQYYIEVDATGVDDLAGNSWAGVAGKDTWDFFTEDAPDVTAPTLVALTPADEATGVNPVGLTASIQLSENIQAGVGNFLLYNYDTDALLASIDVNSVTIAGDTASFDISSYVAVDSHYYILVPAGVLEDLAGNAYAGLLLKEDWDFETDDATAPTPTAYFPAVAATLIAYDTAMYIDASEAMQLGSSGIIKLVQYVDGTGPTDEAGNDIIHHTWDVATTSDITFTNGGLRINFTNAPTLTYSALYYFVIPTGALEDLAGNSFPDHHITGTPSGLWFFTVAPLLSLTFAPGAGSASCDLNPWINAGYSRSMAFRDGWVRLHDYDTDEVIWADWVSVSLGFGINTTSGVFFVLNNLFKYGNNTGDEFNLFNLPAQDGQRVYVIMDSGMIYDPIHNVDLAVPTAKGDWEWTWAIGSLGDGTPYTATPANGETFTHNLDGTNRAHVQLQIDLGDSLAPTDQHSEFDGKYIRIKDYDTGVEVMKISSGNNRLVHLSGDNTGSYGGTQWRIVIPGFVMLKTGKYHVIIDEGFWKGRCSQSFPGIAEGELVLTGPDYDAGALDGFTSGFDTGFN